MNLNCPQLSTWAWRKWVIVGLVSFVATFLALFHPVLPFSPGPPLHLAPELATIQTPAGVTIFAEIADTPDKRSRGLMFRTTLAPDRGMLFVFQELGHWTFWMKNTKIPLDIMWLDKKGTVLHIEHNVPICQKLGNSCPRYRPREKAISVLELRAGEAKKLKLHRGSKLTIEFP